jgi:hypothetical protein
MDINPDGGNDNRDHDGIQPVPAASKRKQHLIKIMTNASWEVFCYKGL